MATLDGSDTGTWDYGLPGAAVRQGDHICAFFFGVVERDSVLLPYLRAGLRGGDRCICVVHASEPSVVLQCIGQETDIDVHQLVESDQLDVRHANDAYLRTGGFSADAMLNFFNEFVATATNAGYDSIRIAGEMSWFLDEPPGSDEFFDYESELNRTVPSYPGAVLCLYDLERFGGGVVVDALRTHPKLLLGGLLLDNPHFVPPDEFRAART
jgi:DcmR-like sensory protein